MECGSLVIGNSWIGLPPAQGASKQVQSGHGFILQNNAKCIHGPTCRLLPQKGFLNASQQDRIIPPDHKVFCNTTQGLASAGIATASASADNAHLARQPPEILACGTIGMWFVQMLETARDHHLTQGSTISLTPCQM